MRIKLTIGAWQVEAEGDEPQIKPYVDRFYFLCEELARIGHGDQAAARALAAAKDPEKRGH